MKIYMVGGAVRDTLLGVVPKDIDYVVVGGTELEMFKAGFQQVGAAFPVFLHPQTGDEYALARVEKKIGDGYHGFQTHIENVTLQEDLGRRDLTINSMAMDDGGSLIDPYGGEHDLAQGILRHTSPAFAEPPAADTDTLAADMIARGDLNHLPNERFWVELHKVFTEKQPERFFTLLHRYGAEKHVTFFKGLYDPSKIAQTCMYASAVGMCINEPDRVMVHTALVGDGDTVGSADTRTQTLHMNIKSMRELMGQQITVDMIFALLKQARAWGSGSGIEDMALALMVSEKLGFSLALTGDQLLSAVKVTSAISSADFLGHFSPGKELGAAIAVSRKAALTTLFNLHDD